MLFKTLNQCVTIRLKGGDSMKILLCGLSFLSVLIAKDCGGTFSEPDCNDSEVLVLNTCEDIEEYYGGYNSFLRVSDIDKSRKGNHNLLRFDMDVEICVMNEMPSRLKSAFGVAVQNANNIEGINIKVSFVQFQCDGSPYKVIIDDSINFIGEIDHVQVEDDGLITGMLFKFQKSEIPSSVTDDELILICTHEIGHMLGLRHPDEWAGNHGEEDSAKIINHFSDISIMYSENEKPDGSYVNLTDFTKYDKNNIKYMYND